MSARSLPDWLSYLEQLHPAAIDMGLDRVREVAARLGLTRPAPRVVTVTGTNGKGSTCAFIASLLRGQGLKVGVYGSPHLLHYNERVRIDDSEVDDVALCEAFEAVESARNGTSLTYFEMGTLAALWLFERANLDAAVLEVGLGGRLDAVNLVDADVAVVTNVGLDHAEWLGDSRESVGFEKSGIFRSAKPAICGDLDPPVSLLSQAESLGVPLCLRGRDYDLASGSANWHWRGVNAVGDQLELHDLPLLQLPLENAALALQTYALLNLPWQPEFLVRALLQARIAGRFDRRMVHWEGRTLSLLLDVGHNPHAASYLAGYLAQQPRLRRLAVFGLLADKDLDGILEVMVPHVSEWAVAPLDSPRSRSATELRAALLERKATVYEYPTVAQALEAQCRRAEDQDEILLFGSFYCVADALKWLTQRTEGTGHGTAG
ncbi:bifunctional tetrahydrofolate synthase/dihydrofolate synthase [Stutzerimonas stutzeri]|uniref:bifunctional tetrahydrofolate synthase/dihydrofolate synthase n=1 Tax=Stutzerimonas sp. S1 TaxID=3030652 RepID=UPI0022254F78|nr:bifunctional tetrahydrofolate synthase/dihydrofolate synthase [Stutzerimonas sp. S1]MCW3148864.1 bifunctional tetrahydrofolate synthase/dihydrofolate synthase [Stutzerimonas sp. S1]